MSKIAGLQAAHEMLTISRTNTARHHLLGYPLHPDDQQPSVEVKLSANALLLVEIEDHLRHLTAMADACRHALAGTVPDEHLLMQESFDPWAAITEQLTEEHCVPVLTLSPALLAWLEARPEQFRRSGAKLLEMFGPDSPFFANEVGDDGHLRRTTEAEKQGSPERWMLASMEQTFFALTYAVDLAQVQQLAATRGDLHQLLALLL